MNILSLFDGISCGRVALERVGIQINNYFSSEIDKYALKISNNNYPNNVCLGSVDEIDIDKLPKIDLLIGGPPCQSLAICGPMTGFKGKSSLFYTYVEILNKLIKKNPDLLFLCENVYSKTEWVNEMTKNLGVDPIKINSALVSAQTRKRIYWTNIPDIKQPEDKGLYLRDVIEKSVENKYYYSERSLKCLDVNACRQKLLNMDRSKRQYYVPEFDYIDNPTVFVLNKKSLCITSNYQKQMPCNYLKSQGQIVFDGDGARRLTIEECERLQTLPQGYTDGMGISDKQRYATIGNGWTVDVIAHIFSHIFS